MHTRLCLVSALLVTVAGPTDSLLHAADKVVGVVWEIRPVTPKGDAQVYWLRATPNGKVWTTSDKSVPKVVGKWTGDAENTKMTIDGLTHPANKKFNGSYEIVLVGKAPRLWRGKFTSATGRERPIVVKLIKN